MDEIAGSDLDQLGGRLVIRVEEAAALLGVCRSTAYDAVRRGDIPVVRVGRRLLVPVPRLLQLLGRDGTDPVTTRD